MNSPATLSFNACIWERCPAFSPARVQTLVGFVSEKAAYAAALQMVALLGNSWNFEVQPAWCLGEHVFTKTQLEVIRVLGAAQRPLTIKLVRELSGQDMKQAKEFVDSVIEFAMAIPVTTAMGADIHSHETA